MRFWSVPANSTTPLALPRASLVLQHSSTKGKKFTTWCRRVTKRASASGALLSNHCPESLRYLSDTVTGGEDMNPSGLNQGTSRLLATCLSSRVDSSFDEPDPSTNADLMWAFLALCSGISQWAGTGIIIPQKHSQQWRWTR